MSYDLIVFDIGSPPKDRDGFMGWYNQQIEWSEEHDYDNPEVCTPELRAWFLELIQEYPALNGPYASDEVDNPKSSDYSLGKSMIYACFAWSLMEDAYGVVFELAKKHQVGIFETSSNDGQIWFPDSAAGWIEVRNLTAL
jgi:hypothetical protein